MKGLYYARVNKDSLKNIGVTNKIRGQVKGFERLGMEVDILWLGERGVFLNDQLIHSFKLPYLSYRWLAFLFYFFALIPLIRKKVKISSYDFLYIRFALLHPMLLGWLMGIKQKWPEKKILMEIPTYPYDQEPRGKAHKLALILSKWLEKKLPRVVDRVITFSNDDFIWKISTIKISNGIDVQSLSLKRKSISKIPLQLIAVGQWSYWHGIDRLIYGMNNYYSNSNSSKPKIQLSIIGDGPERSKYKRLVKKFHLEKWIKFFDPIWGQKLDLHYENSHIAIGNLAIHRKGVYPDASLKHRDYCARGIPFILTTYDRDFDYKLPFVRYFSVTEKAIDLGEILDFVRTIKRKNITSQDIRRYGKQHLSWEVKLKTVEVYLKEKLGQTHQN